MTGSSRTMTSRQRFLAALGRGMPDRLPVTTHHVMPSFLETCLDGASVDQFFDRFGLDPILWIAAYRPDRARGQVLAEERLASGSSAAFPTGRPAGPPRFGSPDCRTSVTVEMAVPTTTRKPLRTTRVDFETPQKMLTLVIQEDNHSGWVSRRLLSEKNDLDVFADHVPVFLCDVDEVNRQEAAWGERGLVRTMVPGFDPYGQPGCWQDAAILFGIEALIMETFYDPAWVHRLLRVLCERKKAYIASMRGARVDLVELGGGDASTTVISPEIFRDFVAPYDAELIAALHEVGLRVVYHTCGGMMPILEAVADMRPDAMETFTPPAMGGDADLAEARRRIGHRVCMIGGFDQFHHLKDCPPETTRAAVRRCFEQAGPAGGFILAPSDHFFEADPACLEAFSDEARACVYG